MDAPAAIRDDLSYFNDEGAPVVFLTLSKPLYDHYVHQLSQNDILHMAGQVCPICHGDFDDDTSVRQIRTCGHSFHEPCLESWLAKVESCPLCGSLLQREYLRVMKPKFFANGLNDL